LFPDSRELIKKFKELIKSPVDAVQLRFKDLTERSLYKAAKDIVAEAKKNNIPIIINDRPEWAVSLGCSGVHLGKADISAKIARKMLGEEAIIGRTIRRAADLKKFSLSDVDYAAIGPVFYTPTKPGLEAVPRNTLREVVKKTNMPLVAIGSINKDNVRQVVKEGIRTVAFVRYGIGGRDTRKRIEELKKKMSARHSRVSGKQVMRVIPA
jgi:thiamine-phosphate pyrophosphorylase